MRVTRLTSPLLVFALAVAACSGSAATSPPSIAPASAAPASVAPASVAASGAATNDASAGGYGKGGSPAAASGAVAVALGMTTEQGPVLVDGKGMTLYVFLTDTATSSACTGTCTTTWRPLLGDTPMLGAGLTGADFASITRPDGTKQITFHGHPLYTYANDKAPGQTNGQRVLNKWYVIDADGLPHIL